MSIATEISRIQAARNKIRTWLIGLGLAESTATIDECAEAVENIVNRGAVAVNIKEGESYTIPAGFHNGSGTVKGIAGGGNYSLQSKTVTPTKSQQTITKDSGYYGLSEVIVGAIPSAYQDVSTVTAAAADVLANKVFVDKSGKSTAGTMPNRGAVNATIDGLNTSAYTIPSGYHSGTGKVSLTGDIETSLATI